MVWSGVMLDQRTDLYILHVYKGHEVYKGTTCRKKTVALNTMFSYFDGLPINNRKY